MSSGDPKDLPIPLEKALLDKGAQIGQNMTASCEPSGILRDPRRTASFAQQVDQDAIYELLRSNMAKIRDLGRRGQVFLLTEPSVTIGRSDACNVQVEEKLASRFHAQLEWGWRGWFLTDLGSRNGTWIHHEGGGRSKVGDRTLLAPGDVFSPGFFGVRLELTDDSRPLARAVRDGSTEVVLEPSDLSGLHLMSEERSVRVLCRREGWWIDDGADCTPAPMNGVVRVGESRWHLDLPGHQLMPFTATPPEPVGGVSVLPPSSRLVLERLDQGVSATLLLDGEMASLKPARPLELLWILASRAGDWWSNEALQDALARHVGPSRNPRQRRDNYTHRLRKAICEQTSLKIREVDRLIETGTRGLRLALSPIQVDLKES